ncbi:OmpA family protein [Flavobacterium sp. 7A]|uniref:OmpA family protein n=1 Tax=Flavobacterium sp. 7A TaxID=2940571 RepID=UPI002226458A|nr:OmpA family protein [Flavobacterium sp. 7A]MCW2119763.1 outer membrane protein OmpA-like peptidoglycan-associated protein [Flavobacterium sp. 7A]
MTKTELSSFLSTVAEARRSQLKERENRQVKQDLADLRLKYQQNNQFESYTNNSISNQQLVRELNYLNQRIDNLSSSNRTLPTTGRNSSTIILPSQSNSSPMYAQKPVETRTVVASPNTSRIKELEAKIDSLRNVKPVVSKSRISRMTNDSLNTMRNQLSEAKSQKANDSLNAMRNQLSKIKKQMNDLQAKIKASENKVSTVNVSNKEKTYWKQQVYFANNSETLANEYYKYIQDLTQILNEYPEANILLEGWASPSGNSAYNKQLSMRRADAVKNAFVNNRIDASRILATFKGEDKTSTAQHARRVDMSITVK